MKSPVTLEQIVEQMEKGWVDFHPEDYCHRCGRPNVCWFVASDLWNQVDVSSEATGVTGEKLPSSGIVCPSCFVEMFEAKGLGRLIWELRPEAPAPDMWWVDDNFKRWFESHWIDAHQRGPCACTTESLRARYEMSRAR